MTSIEKLYQYFIQSSSVCTDTRKIGEKCLFFALKGENFNGNKFAAEAIKKGALKAVIDEKEFENENTILVDNVLQTFQKLARFHREKLGVKIIAITGTNGKTTTKELISAILAEKYAVNFTRGNLNNHIGVPLTLLEMNKKTEIGVVEMGANHPGEISQLCQIADPDFGIITNIGKAHLEGFGSFEGVIQTKGELFKYIADKKGTIFLNGNNPILVNLAKNISNKILYGNGDFDLKGEPLLSPPFAHAKVRFKKGVLYLNSNLIGSFNFENILAAACIGNYFNVDPLKIQSAIKTYTPRNNRSQLIKKGDLNIIMDAYNANPTSMQLSIKSFLSQKNADNYLVLGDMLELGEFSDKEHLEVLELIKAFDVKQVFLVGANFSKLAGHYPYHSFANVEELSTYLQAYKIKKGNLLIKGSRGIRLEKILEILN